MRCLPAPTACKRAQHKLKLHTRALVRRAPLIGLISLTLAASAPLTKDQEGQVYDEAVHILGGNANVISKWVDDIRLAVIGEAQIDMSLPPATRKSTTGKNRPSSEPSQETALQGPAVPSAKLAYDILTDIAVQTDLNLRFVQTGIRDARDYLTVIEQNPAYQLAACAVNDQSVCANFVVLFSDASTMQQLARAIPLRPVYQSALERSNDVPCFFAPFQTRSLEIAQAFVFVREDLSAAMLRTCLQEEIYQSFGLFNDFSRSAYFSFNNVVEPKEITDYDRALLASVYDPEFKPGAPVFRVIKRFMENLGIDPFTK